MGKLNSLRLKSSVGASKHLWSNIYFAGDGTLAKTMAGAYLTSKEGGNSLFVDLLMM